MKKERGEFETVLKETVSKKDAIIAQQKAELKAVRIDDELLKEASNQQAKKPQQVVNLLKNKVQLSEDGKAEITCEFCKEIYSIKEIELKRILLEINSD